MIARGTTCSTSVTNSGCDASRGMQLVQATRWAASCRIASRRKSTRFEHALMWPGHRAIRPNSRPAHATFEGNADELPH